MMAGPMPHPLTETGRAEAGGDFTPCAGPDICGTYYRSLTHPAYVGLDVP
jgi:hypothetical protein